MSNYFTRAYTSIFPYLPAYCWSSDSVCVLMCIYVCICDWILFKSLLPTIWKHPLRFLKREYNSPDQCVGPLLRKAVGYLMTKTFKKNIVEATGNWPWLLPEHGAGTCPWRCPCALSLCWVQYKTSNPTGKSKTTYFLSQRVILFESKTRQEWEGSEAWMAREISEKHQAGAVSSKGGGQWPKVKSSLMEVWWSVQLSQNFFLVLQKMVFIERTSGICRQY